MRGHRFARAARFILFAIVAALALGFIVMHLWNWLMPPVFGLRIIGFWQALGLLLLSKILFGGFPWRTLGRHALAPPHDGTLGANDARGTREIPRRHAKPLRLLRAALA